METKNALFGVIYIASGNKFVDEACISVASLKSHCSKIPATAFLDPVVDNANFEKIISIKKGSSLPKLQKLIFMSQAPYDMNLFLDTDTYVCGDISELFCLLDNFDIAIAHAPYRKTIEKKNVPQSFPEFNTGVIAFRNTCKVQLFLKNWLDLYQKDLQREIIWNRPGSKKNEIFQQDQASFREALYKSDLRVATLTPEYNCRFGMIGYVHGKVKIIHGRHSNLERVASDLNKIELPRAHYLDGSNVKLLSSDSNAHKSLSALAKLKAKLKQILNFTKLYFFSFAGGNS